MLSCDTFHTHRLFKERGSCRKRSLCGLLFRFLIKEERMFPDSVCAEMEVAVWRPKVSNISGEEGNEVWSVFSAIIVIVVV